MRIQCNVVLLTYLKNFAIYSHAAPEGTISLNSRHTSITPIVWNDSENPGAYFAYDEQGSFTPLPREFCALLGLQKYLEQKWSAKILRRCQRDPESLQWQPIPYDAMIRAPRSPIFKTEIEDNENEEQQTANPKEREVQLCLWCDSHKGFVNIAENQDDQQERRLQKKTVRKSRHLGNARCCNRNVTYRVLAIVLCVVAWLGLVVCLLHVALGF